MVLFFSLIFAYSFIAQTYEKGNISKHVSLLSLGQTIRVKGPKGNFLYTPNLVQHVTMIAGGTGIAPMMQVIHACFKNPADHSKITLIYANVNEEDILLREDLKQLQKVYGEDRFKILYVLNNPPSGWNGGVGFVSKDHIKENIPNPNSSDSKLLLCGNILTPFCSFSFFSFLFCRSSSYDYCHEVSSLSPQPQSLILISDPPEKTLKKLVIPSLTQLASCTTR